MAASLSSNLHTSPVLPSHLLRQDDAVLTAISRTAKGSCRRWTPATVVAAVARASGENQVKSVTSDGESTSTGTTRNGSSSSADGGKMPAPGFYGGAPLDRRVRQSWGGKREDPLTSGSYIWNTDWDKALDGEEVQRTVAAAAAGKQGEGKRVVRKPPPSLTPSASSSSSAGFLSLGRSLALDSLDIDLSREIMAASTASLEQQVEVARQQMGIAEEYVSRPATPSDGTPSQFITPAGNVAAAAAAAGESPVAGSTDSSSSSDGIRWRFAPTTKEQKRWQRKQQTVNMLVGSQLKKESIDPAVVMERERQHYEQLKQSLFISTAAMGALFTGMAAFTYSPGVTASYAAGAVGSLVYVRMLSSSVEAVGANSVEGAVRGAAGQPRLLVPVVMVMAFNRWNTILVPTYDIIPLELIPMLVGFFTYKAATILQAIQDVMSVIEPSSSSGSSSDDESPK